MSLNQSTHTSAAPRPKVAIITRTKNRTLLLRRAIEDVLAQIFQDWLLVIVNDGGVPEDIEALTQEYRERFKDRCRIIHNPTSVGMEAASNIGIKASDSDYLVIHDDDDSWHPAFLQKCVDFLGNNPYPSFAGVITHSIRVLEKLEEGRIVPQSQEPFNTWMRTVTLYRMSASNTFTPISFVYQRSVLERIGYYREDLPVLGDWEFNLRFMRYYDIYLIPEELAYYHHRLETKQGEYSNSVVKDDDKHVFYDSLIRNELLRRDMAENRVGLGYLVNLGKSFEVLHAQIAPIETFLTRLKKITWLRRLGKRLLWGPRKKLP
jgi:glycosyltransferase involved in cell wall biosynthesis